MRRPLLVAAALTAALALSACSTSSAPPSTTVAVRSVTVTAAVRHALVVAGASSHSLPTSDFVGLAAGTTYYAFDATTDTYYAAARLDPSPHSLPAQVATQDDGAYDLFTRAEGGAWTVYNDGLGAAHDSVCPLALPAKVLAVWGWAPGSCYPPQS